MKRTLSAVILSLAILAAFVIPTPTFADPADPWYDTDWLYRVELTIQNAQVDADLTDYTVYVRLADLPAGFHTNVNSNGGDIRVTTTDGTTEVPREVVVYDAGTDTGELHAKLPMVANATDTTLYIYYGNSGASDYAITDTYGAENVWTDYKAVYHLQEAANTTSGGYLDSTANNQDGTGVSMTASVGTGKLGGRAAGLDGVDDMIGLPSGLGSLAGATSEQSVQAWVNVMGNDGQIVSLRGPGMGNAIFTMGYGYDGADNGNTGRPHSILRDDAQIGLRHQHIATNINGAGWSSLHLTRNSSKTNNLFLNGVSGVSGGDTMTGALTTTLNTIGSDQSWILNSFATQAQRFVDGFVDEVRIRNGALTPQWIDAEYANINTPTTFYSVGSQEDVPITGETPIPIRINGGTIRINGGSVVIH